MPSLLRIGTGTETGMMAGRRWHTDGVYQRWEMGARWSIAITTHLMGRRSLQLVFSNFCCCSSVLRMRFLLLLLLYLSLFFFFFFFLHKTLLICFTCHTKLELSWVFKKRSAPASPASSTSCPRVCVCVETTQTVDIYHQGCPSRGWKLSNLSPGPGLAREACAVISFAFIFRGCKLEKCCMKINKS